ncbi:MAG: AAA family ATPase, partial [Planctomycetes bacterium]|nr:AAA family ATPase [Planctomycetota bacterium]
MSFLQIKSDQCVELDVRDDGTRRVHVFDDDSILAANMAWAAERPLLVRGEPGVGKSQLAEAVARHTNRKFISFVVDSKTEARDLLWRFDAVKRLADAQLIGAMGRELSAGKPESEDQQMQTIRQCVNVDLAEGQYIKPGPLWWAFDWQSAQSQDEISHANSPYPGYIGDPANGCVVLIDEIDKAESDVPNGLLAALGAQEFQPFGLDTPVRQGENRPLVIIT